MKELIEKYNQGLATEEEIRTIGKLIEAGEIDLSDLKTESALLSRLQMIPVPDPSAEMDSKFYEMLRTSTGNKHSYRLASLWQHFPVFRWAYSVILVAAGIGAGYLLNNNESSEVAGLTKEVSEMKEMMMLTLLEKESTSDRLKAVHLTSDLPGVSSQVTGALIRTLNEDENVNVRLATIEALYPYARDPAVREALVSSIRNQESPLVQVALAELMVALQEKGSVDELRFLLEKDGTPEEVRSKLMESINILI